MIAYCFATKVAAAAAPKPEAKPVVAAAAAAPKPEAKPAVAAKAVVAPEKVKGRTFRE